MGFKDLIYGRKRDFPTAPSSIVGGLNASDFGAPGPSPGHAQGGQSGINQNSLDPNSRAENMANGIPYQLVPVYPPFVRMANDPNIVYFPRYRSFRFGANGTVAGTTTQTMNTGLPTYVIAMTGTAFDAGNAALPVGRTSLQLFSFQISTGQGSQDLLTVGGGNTTPNFNVVAENILGTGGLPGFVPCTGLFIDTATPLNVTCQILRDNVQADITFWCIEEWAAPRSSR